MLDGGIGEPTVKYAHPFSQSLSGIGINLGFDLACDQVSARCRRRRSVAGVSFWPGGANPIAVLPADPSQAEVLGPRTWIYRAAGLVPVFQQLPDLLLGDRIVDVGDRRLDVFYRDTDEHR